MKRLRPAQTAWHSPGLYLKLSVTRILIAATGNDALATNASTTRLAATATGKSLSAHKVKSVSMVSAKIPITTDAKTTLNAQKNTFA